MSNKIEIILDKTIDIDKVLEYMSIHSPELKIRYIGMRIGSRDNVYELSTDKLELFYIAGLSINTFLKLNDTTFINKKTQ